MIDLSSNESYFAPSERIIKEVTSELCNINLYVDSSKISELRKSVAKYCGIREERIVIGPGTDWINKEIISRFGSGKDIVLLNPSFSKSLLSAKYISRRIMKIQLVPPDFQISWTGCMKDSCLIFIDSPNNPTGQCLIEEQQLVELLENENHLVIIDEAGFEYSGKTFINLVEQYDNLAITRTFDKAFGLAGFRISWLVAGDRFLKRLKPEDSLISRLGCLAAIVALEEKEHMKKNVEIMFSERDFLRNSLIKLGIRVFDSEANYLLISTDIDDFALKLRESGILIEDLSKTWMKGFSRITVGTRQENLAFIKAIQNQVDVEKNSMW
ncbi:MAG: aminotransferase class I/II-fold pyridoxal phosphate-dependent enzyme [Bacteroidales bacterium]|nr:aminotransferase class I/II-fold pyridoxal phosphate-dependent enzyme [Bacteroidales bacterium]